MSNEIKKKLFIFVKYLIVAICSAIASYFTSSCAGGIVIGHRNRQLQEVNASSDSSRYVPTISINR